MVTDSMTDRRVLRERQYAGPGNLAARQALWSYRTGPDARATRLDALGLTGAEETVLDVGCGNGLYLAELRRRGHTGPRVGLDLSAGMARAAAASGAAVAVADAAHLPVAGGTALMDEAVSAVTGQDRGERRFSFTLETAAGLLAGAFDQVTTHESVDVVRVPEPEPVIAYLASFGPDHVGVSDQARWEAYLDAVAAMARARVHRDGEIQVTSHTGHLVCR